jgi:D-xylose 1-dehydrogenase (NADP+, D-xylono-1,5-lactone-forming)
MSTAAINRLFLAGVRDSAEIEVVAVASRTPDTAERFAREHGIERALASYEALLADPEVEVVYIPLPNSMHIDWSVQALEAGKHVLCEKPLSRRTSEVDRAFDVAEREGRLLMEAFMYRHHPQTERLVQMVQEGAVGHVQMIRAAFSFRARDRSDIRLAAGLDGGALMDVGCYCVSGARLIAGEPERVAAEQTVGGDGVDVAFTATMRFSGDVLAHFDAGLTLPPERDELEVIGEAGALFLGDPWHCRQPLIELRRESGSERIEVQAADPYRLEGENMSAAIRGEAPPLLGREDAVGQARAIEALYRSAESGQMVSL